MAVSLVLVAYLSIPIILAYFLYAYGWNFMKQRLRMVELVEKIPGPPAIPILGNTHQFKLDKVGSKWKSRRRMLTPAFHFSILKSFVEIHGEKGKILVEQLRPMAKEGICFDIFPFLGRAALDVICESAMGVNVNAQKESNSEYVRAAQKMSELVMKHERMPWLQIKPIWYLLGYGAIYDKCMALLKGFTKKVIEERSGELHKLANEQGIRVSELRPEGKRMAFLDLLLIMQEENRLTFQDISNEVDTFMFEGHDTTASGMGWTIFLLGHEPEIQEKIYEEMLQIFGDSGRLPSAEDLKSMRYLEQVIKEGLRLYPPVPLFGRNVTENFYTGYIVPKGSVVFAIPFAIHRDPQYYGPNPEKFDPDRFQPQKIGNRHPFSYVPFSAGSRNCIGQKFALMEEKMILSQIVRNFRVKSLEAKEVVRPIPDIILRPPERFLVRLSPRE